MNLIETLRQANGKPISRPGFSPEGISSIDGKGIMLWTKCDSIGNVAVWHPTVDALLADDWYVVEPKSKIEEAIEWEAVNARGASTISSAEAAMRRVVNLALDEAKSHLLDPKMSGMIKDIIDGLKVKE